MNDSYNEPTATPERSESRFEILNGTERAGALRRAYLSVGLTPTAAYEAALADLLNGFYSEAA